MLAHTWINTFFNIQSSVGERHFDPRQCADTSLLSSWIKKQTEKNHTDPYIVLQWFHWNFIGDIGII